MIARVRAHAQRWLSQRCTIELENPSLSPFGDPVSLWQVVASDVPCRLVRAGSRTTTQLQQPAGAESLQQTYRLAVAPDVHLANDMRVTVAGDVYHVVAVEQQLSDEVFRHAILVKR